MNLARPVSRSLVRSVNLSHVMLRASRSKSRVADAFVGDERRQKTERAQAGFDGKGFADERRSVYFRLFSRGPHPQHFSHPMGEGGSAASRKAEARTWLQTLRAARAPWPPPKALAAELQGVFKPALSDGASFAKAQNHVSQILLSIRQPLGRRSLSRPVENWIDMPQRFVLSIVRQCETLRCGRGARPLR